MRRLAVLFTVFIILVVVAADLGFFNRLLNFINRVPYLDKVLHFLLIGTLTFLAIGGGVEAYPRRNPLWIVLIAMGALAVVFTLEEISQGPIRGRDASWLDLGSNYAGILFFGFLAWFRFGRRTNS